MRKLNRSWKLIVQGCTSYSCIYFLSRDTFQKEKIIVELIYDNFALNDMTFK